MNKLNDTLKEIAARPTPYAEAVSAVLQNISPQIDAIPLSQTVISLLGSKGLPTRAPTDERELIALCEALARSLTAYIESDDNEEVPDFRSVANEYRVRYQNLTDDQLLDLNDAGMFAQMSSIERQAAASVLIDLSVDRNLRCPDLWQTIVTNMGRN